MREEAAEQQTSAGYCIDTHKIPRLGTRDFYSALIKARNRFGFGVTGYNWIVHNR